MKQEFKPMSWIVKYFDCNAQAIKDYDVLKYREDDIKKMKKIHNTKGDFGEALRREMMWRFWSKCEWELIIEITQDNRVFLNPWVGCHEPELVKIDVTDCKNFDWDKFARIHIVSYKPYGDLTAKIDVFDQLRWKWDDFVDYCWNYRHKWQRRKKND